MIVLPCMECLLSAPCLDAAVHSESAAVRTGDIAKTWLSFMLLYNWVIPISLYVTLELQKFSGSWLINWDKQLFCPKLQEPATARTSGKRLVETGTSCYGDSLGTDADLIEDLGQVEHVFADKTGTLTENMMVFKKCNVMGTAFEVRGDYESLIEVDTPRNVFTDKRGSVKLENVSGPGSLTDIAPSGDVRRMFLCLALCHTVTVEEEGEADTK